MMDGFAVPPIPETRASETRGRDLAAAAAHAGAAAAPTAPAGQGPPASDPLSRWEEGRENRRPPDRREPSPADEEDGEGSGQSGGQGFPGEPGRSLAIRIDRDSGRPVFEIRDDETGRVVRQVPPAELEEWSRRMPELLRGLLVNDLV